MSTPTRKIRWGILGYARIARLSVIPALRHAGNAVLAAVASQTESRRAEVAAAEPGVRVHASYEDLVRDPDLDAVYVPLPNSLHREWTIKAAAHRKHVLCEKPIALNAAECREMIQAAGTHRVTLMEAFMYRYTPRTQKVVEILRSGVLGEIRQVDASFRFLLNRPSIKQHAELGGGALYDVGCYPLNFIGLVVDTLAGKGPGGGGQPERVSAHCVRQGGVDVNFAALLQYGSGLLATVQCGFNAHRRIQAVIIGTEGTLEVPDAFLGEGAPLTLWIGEERREIAVAPCDRYLLEIEDFSAAILDSRPPALGMRETLRNAEVMDRLFAALR